MTDYEGRNVLESIGLIVIIALLVFLAAMALLGTCYLFNPERAAELLGR